MMSLRWRIMGATVLIVVITVVISVGVGYYASQSRLDVFVDRIGEDEAVRLARSLSREYAAAGGWGTVDTALAESGYTSGESTVKERHGDERGEDAEGFHLERVRVVVAGIDGRVVKDNFSVLPPGSAASGLDGHREPVLDLASNQPVGYVYVDVNRELLSTESHGFLSALLYIALIGGALTVGIAILLAAWLSKRITAPVTALTDATQAIAQGDATSLPVRSSDELGRMSAAFNRMSASLETQRELRRRLINDVSHELNTPLSVIRLEAGGLRDGLQTPEGASGQIIQEVDRLRGLVTDLDWLAETDSGRLRLTLESGSISELLSAEMDRWQAQSQARQVGLSLQVSGEIPDMDVDLGRMRQALGNVVNNAVNCTGAGGSIVIRAGLENGENLVILVTDDGFGIDPADLPHIFDRFYRTDQSRSRGVVGTGLGLAITRAIIEAHGGTIAVTSDGIGRGVSVTVRVPVKARTSSA